MSEPSVEVPRFAVVGRVNKGKSSIIASLIENDAVKISPRPGTTTECVRYDVEVDGRVLFSVIDTPGFEDAPRALHWIKQREVTAADRVQRVRELVEAFDGTEDFVEERRLLRPILDGAAILYVVNGDEPYRKNYETEMEVLRYTGQPAMALINRSGAGEH
ncbi:MAG: 50S ribosome-binding GTPase, partial [Deltaproteobacteria bacterium]|nr:50S ribosome-binding GTPase [Deltaproteobacteria bacterium]